MKIFIKMFSGVIFFAYICNSIILIMQFNEHPEKRTDINHFKNTIIEDYLYERINKRVDIMIEQGLIEEVKEVYNKYEKFPTAMQGLGYKEVVQYLENELTKEEMIEKIKQETRRYAKRQLTWFRKNKQTIWLNAQDEIQNNIRIILEGLN